MDGKDAVSKQYLSRADDATSALSDKSLAALGAKTRGSILA